MIETRERKATDNSIAASVTSPQELTGGQALVTSLITNGVDTVFALPGVQLDGAFDALYAERDAIRVIHPRHEQAAAYMADGYARTTGKVGACMVVRGRGCSMPRPRSRRPTPVIRRFCASRDRFSRISSSLAAASP